MTHATPRPWTYQLDPSYTTHGGWKCEVSTTLGEKIASVFASSKGEAKERAALIVHAVNTLDEAKAVITECLIWLQGAQANQGHCETLHDVCEQAKAILADMEGGAR